MKPTTELKALRYIRSLGRMNENQLARERECLTADTPQLADLARVAHIRWNQRRTKPAAVFACLVRAGKRYAENTGRPVPGFDF